MNFLQTVLLFLIICSASVTYANVHSNKFILKIINRWLRWIIFSVLFIVAHEYFAEPGVRPFWLLFTTGFLVYALFETVINWLEISALSYSEMSLFPKFRANNDGDEWPSHKKYLKVKDWLRDNDFVHLQSIKSNLTEDVYIRSSIYEDKNSNSRCQILFLPQRNASVAMCYIFTSCTDSGNRYITDNIFIPYGGFYPENWYIIRKPMAHSIGRVFNIHKKRLKKSVETFTEWDDGPLDDINNQQKQLESVNIDLGFLYPQNYHEEHGKISNNGRYRMWKEIWLMNYLGIAVNA